MALAIAAPVTAQDYEDEIIVTATKRATTLQETAVAVAVVPETVIEQAKISDIKDLQSVVPSLRVTQLQSSQNTNFLIRGFGNGANNAGIEPAVGVFIDGVYRSRAAAQIGDLPKLERVEVLKGPQSTLYGKNSSAGVISIVTAKPSYETTGYVEAGYGNYNAFNLKGYLSGGDDDGKYAFSLGGGMNMRDGYAKSANSLTPDLNDRDRWNIRAQALFTPSDNFEARLIYDISKIDEQCCLTGFLDAANGLTPDGTAFGGLSVIGAITTPTNLGGLGGNVNDPFAYVADFNGAFDNFVDDSGVSLHLDWGLGGVDVTSITSYRNNEGGYDTEVDYTNLPLADSVRLENDISTFTQELRFAGSFDQADWLVGGYYFNEDITSDTSLEYGAGMRAYADLLTGGALAGIEQILMPTTPYFAQGAGTAARFTQDDEAWSVFGQLDFDVTDRLTITVGGNYTDDKKDVSFAQTRNTDTFAQIDLDGAEGIQVLTVGGLADTFGQFSGSCLDANNMLFGALPFSPQNVGLILTTSPGCFVQPDPNQPPVAIPASDAYNGYLALVQAGAINLAGSPNNPLLGLASFQFLPPLTGFPNAFENGKSDDNKFTYTIRGAYEVSDNLNVYASYATGFKATSWNLSRDTRPTTAYATNGVPIAHPNEGLGTRFAGPEETSVIELGLKARFAKGALNLAVFDQSIEGFQSNLFQGTGFKLVNAGEQSARGVEWDATYNPIDALRLDFSGTYLDPKFDSFQNAPGPFGYEFDRTGDRPTGIHEWSMNFAATYNHDFGNGMEGYIRGSYLYESPVQIVPNYATVSQLTAQGFTIANTLNGLNNTERKVSTFDASAGISLDNGISLQVWGRNIFNDEYLMSAFPGVAQPGTFYGYPNPPRTYGAALRYDF